MSDSVVTPHETPTARTIAIIAPVSTDSALAVVNAQSRLQMGARR